MTENKRILKNSHYWSLEACLYNSTESLQHFLLECPAYKNKQPLLKWLTGRTVPKECRDLYIYCGISIVWTYINRLSEKGRMISLPQIYVQSSSEYVYCVYRLEKYVWLLKVIHFSVHFVYQLQKYVWRSHRCQSVFFSVHYVYQLQKYVYKVI